MTPTASPPTKLNSLQISLLRLFERGMSDEQTLELQRLLVKAYLAVMRQEAGRIDDERGHTTKDHERMLSEPSRCGGPSPTPIAW